MEIYYFVNLSHVVISYVVLFCFYLNVCDIILFPWINSGENMTARRKDMFKFILVGEFSFVQYHDMQKISYICLQYKTNNFGNAMCGEQRRVKTRGKIMSTR